MVDVEITLQYFEGCPNWRLADERLRVALQETVDSDAHRIVYERVETTEQAEARGFRGSPTILVDGRDPFADEQAPVGLSCRIYQTDTGPDGAPSVAQLTQLFSG